MRIQAYVCCFDIIWFFNPFYFIPNLVNGIYQGTNVSGNIVKKMDSRHDCDKPFPADDFRAPKKKKKKKKERGRERVLLKEREGGGEDLKQLQRISGSSLFLSVSCALVITL